MRVLLTSWGSRGDVEPLAGLAVALRDLGAESALCVPSDDDFTALADRAGVPLIPLGPSVRSVVNAPKPTSGPHPAFDLARRLVAARFETPGAVGNDYDAIVATGLMPAGARDVADNLGLRYVLATFHLGGIPSQQFSPGARPGTPSPADETDRRVLWEQDAQRVNALYGEAVNTHRAAIGLPPVDNVRDYVLTDRPWLAADPTLCPSEGMTELDVDQTGAWFLNDDRPLPDDLAVFLDAGEPPVYVGFGSMASHAPQGIGQAAVEACRAHNRRIVLSHGWSHLDVTTSTDCFVAGEINLQAMVPRVAAVVHHGGAGTTTAAARAGTPQLVVPLLGDQSYWASRVTALGIGAAHEGTPPTADSLSEALDIVLAADARARAAQVAGQIKTDGAAEAAKQLVTGS
jgi:vancomycin aglycone glucosyltransferase